MNKCVLIPQVRDKDNNLRKSILFTDLLKFTNNRDDTYTMYQATRTPYFKGNWLNKLELDTNGEPRLTSLLNKTNITTLVGDKKLLTKLNSDIGGWINDRKKLYLYNQSNSSMLSQRCIQFNKSELGTKYVATVNKIQDSESNRVFLSPTIRLRTPQYSLEANQMAYNEALNNSLRDLMGKWGINVGSLTKLEEGLGINGVEDFSQASEAADGISSIIRIAQGDKGEQALPEEFSHFIIDALHESPLVNRLISLLQTKGLIKEILGEDYDNYVVNYKGNDELLAKESAGKLMAQYLTNEKLIPDKPYKNILSTLINYVKNFFSTLSSSDIDKAKLDAYQQVGNIAKDVFSGSYDTQLNINSLLKDKEGTTPHPFYSLGETMNKEESLLNNIINRELKRYKIYENRNPSSKFNMQQASKIKELEDSIENHQAIKGIYSFTKGALNTMGILNNRLRELNQSATIQEKSALLRDIRNYIFSYKNSISDIRAAMIEDESTGSPLYDETIKEALDKTTSLLAEAQDRYNKAAMPVFLQFIKPFMSGDIVIPFGKNKGKRISVEQLVKEADSDISTLDRWVDSMSNSSDYMLKLFDQAVKISKEQKRLKVIDLGKQITAAAQKVRNSGISEFNWMFEKDRQGKLTGNYIDNIDWGLLKENKTKFFTTLNEKYGKDPVGENGTEYRKEISTWYHNNYENIAGTNLPKSSIYNNQAFSNLTPVQREFYNTFRGMMDNLIALLPEKTMTNKNQAIQIRKDLMERMLSSGNISEAASHYKEDLKDQLLDRSDDDEFGTKTDIEDFEGKKVRSIPIYYANKIEDTKSLSTDVVSTFIAFADMATNYDEMNKVIDSLEVGRDLMKERQIQDTRAGKPLVQKINALGRNVTMKINKGESNFMARLNSFFDMQVYGVYMKDEGKILGLNTGKVANFINKLTSLNGLALNLLSGVSTVAHDITQINAEAVSGQFFNASHLAKADATYLKGIAESMNDVGSRTKTSKMNLFIEKFNLLQEYEENARDAKYDKSRAQRFFSTNSLYFMMHAGDHWGQTRIGLALANNYKMKSPEGNIVSLYDAMGVTSLDKNNPNLGATIDIKPGYTKEDGSQFTTRDIIDFSKRAMALNERLYGIYNKADRNALQTLALGRMAMMYRKYLIPAMERRFSAVTYNMDLQDYTEGYYRTTGRFLLQLAKDLKSHNMIWGTRYNELNETEKANMKRAITETAQWLALCTVLSLMNMGPKDKKRIWAARAAEYFATRLKTDVGSLTPTPGMVGDLWKIMKSPAAGMETMQNLGGMLNAVYPVSWFQMMHSGRFKGHSLAYKALMQSPFIPGSASIYRVLHPETAVQAYK